MQEGGTGEGLTDARGRDGEGLTDARGRDGEGLTETAMRINKVLCQMQEGGMGGWRGTDRHRREGQQGSVADGRWRD